MTCEISELLVFYDILGTIEKQQSTTLALLRWLPSDQLVGKIKLKMVTAHVN